MYVYAGVVLGIAVPLMKFVRNLRKQGLNWREVLSETDDLFALHFQTVAKAEMFTDFIELVVRVEKAGDGSHGRRGVVQDIEDHENGAPSEVVVRLEGEVLDRKFDPSELLVEPADLAKWTRVEEENTFGRELPPSARASVPAQWTAEASPLASLMVRRDSPPAGLRGDGVTAALCRQLTIQHCMGEADPAVAILSQLAIQFGQWTCSAGHQSRRKPLGCSE